MVVKLNLKTRRDYAFLVMAGTFLYTLLIVMVGAVLPHHDRLFYNAVLIPAIFVATAVWLANRTHTHDWLTLRGPQFSLDLALRFVGLVAVLVLASRLLNASLMSRFGHPDVRGLERVLFRCPEPSLPVFRSVVGSPVGEEILFRGWMMSWLRERDLAPTYLGRHHIDTPNLLTSLSFAAVHILNRGILSVILIFFISLLLGKARNRSGGILLPMVLHAVINFINHSVLVPLPS